MGDRHLLESRNCVQIHANISRMKFLLVMVVVLLTLTVEKISSAELFSAHPGPLKERTDEDCVPCSIGSLTCCDQGDSCCFDSNNTASACAPPGGSCCAEGHSCSAETPVCCGPGCIPTGATCCSHPALPDQYVWCREGTECDLSSDGESLRCLKEGSPASRLRLPFWWIPTSLVVSFLYL